MHKKINLIGEKFGRLIVLMDSGQRRNEGVVWQCLCDCGKIKNIASKNLLHGLNGRTKSCGCFSSEVHSDLMKLRNFKHGDKTRKTINRLYYIWQGMKNRCNDKKDRCFKYYGARGIKLCADWGDNYLSFKTWALTNGYRNDLTIDRIDNDNGYFPENCQWITMSENISKSHKERSGHKET